MYFLYVFILGAEDLEGEFGMLALDGEMTITATLVFAISMWKLAIIDAYMLIACTSRFLILIYSFSRINDRATGYDPIDPKILHDAVEDVGLPALILFTTNWKIQICLAAPIMLISQQWTIRTSYIDEGDNMSCYKDPNVVAFEANVRYLVYFCIIMGAVHKERANQVTIFVEQAKTKKQQECLQNVFDALEDGVVILSEKIVPLPEAPNTLEAV